MERTEELRMREVHLPLPLTTDAVRGLELGDAVFLNGLLFTGREGFYQRVFEQGIEAPLDIRHTCNVTFHCSPAVNEPSPGGYHIPAVTATASFRFAKHVPLLLECYGVRAVRGALATQLLVQKAVACAPPAHLDRQPVRFIRGS
jgi:L(+)-tartrate dehydratase beta subunit